MMQNSREETASPNNEGILRRAIRAAIPQGTRTSVWLLKLTIPVSFAVFLIDYLGILAEIARLVAPFFNWFGLSGSASVVLITSFFTNIYSSIAVMSTLGIPAREGLILANMCLIAHALIVETGIQRKTGSSALRMILVRLSASFLAAWLLNLVLPAQPGEILSGSAPVQQNFTAAFLDWLKAISITSIKIVVLVNLLLIVQKLLSELKVLEWLVKPLHPLLRVMGLPSQTGFLWMVAYTLGLSYGGAIMISQSEEGKLSREEADLLNHHIAISHSQLEDPLLFAAVGFSIPWLIFPRFFLALLYVWARRLELYLRQRSHSYAQPVSG